MLELLRRRGTLQTADAVQALGVSRMTAYRRLRELVDRKLVVSKGRGPSASYELASARLRLATEGLDEHEVATRLDPALRALFPLSAPDAAAINFGLTEMVNNAIDHSGGRHVVVEARRRGPWLELEITDDGAGVFATLRTKLGLESDRDALVQLEKGKVTTMPAGHSGEGIFFTSKIAHRFRLESGALAWVVDNERDDRGIELVKPARRGTRVLLAFKPGEIEPYEQVFARFTRGAEHRFAKTRVTVRLVDSGEALISRSEAKRIVAGLEKFEQVTLDFSGVSHVGQGFVDEVFRVFGAAHPTIEIEPIHMDAAVAFMVGRNVVPAATAMPVPATAVPTAGVAPAFFLQKPERFMRAWSQMAAAPNLPAHVQVMLAAPCVRALMQFGADDDVAGDRLRTCFDSSGANSAVELLMAERSLARLDAVDASKLEALARRGVACANGMLSRIAGRPELWRFFVDDEGMVRFWGLAEEKRRELWGEPVSDGATLAAQRPPPRPAHP